MLPLISGGQPSFVKVQLSRRPQRLAMARKVGRRGNFRVGKTRPGQTRPKFKFLREIHDDRYRPPNPPPINPSPIPHSHLPLYRIPLPPGVLACRLPFSPSASTTIQPPLAPDSLPLGCALQTWSSSASPKKVRPIPSSSSSSAARPNWLGHEILIHPTAATLLSDDPSGASTNPALGLSFLYALSHPPKSQPRPASNHGYQRHRPRGAPDLVPLLRDRRKQGQLGRAVQGGGRLVLRRAILQDP